MEGLHFSCYEKGKGRPLVLLNGLFGSLANWRSIIEGFCGSYRVMVPELPTYTHPKKRVRLSDLVDYLRGFVAHFNIKDFVLFGNSLGGQLAVAYTVEHPQLVSGLVLMGSSGIVEQNILGSSFPRINDRSYVERMTEICFYDPSVPHPEIVQEVWERTREYGHVVRLISLGKSALADGVEKASSRIQAPTLIVWGLNDTITPPYAAYKFHRLISNSTLHFIDNCCHVPMMEHPERVNYFVGKYLETAFGSA